MAERENFWKGWRERFSALRNVRPVLRIVWESGPVVVGLGLAFRFLASFVPVLALWITKLIIDTIVRAVAAHRPVEGSLWWLVAAEFALAIFGSVLGRTIDYLDALLADNYTRHVSIQVMKHAADLDLLAYENPVFYDRLERARVQATDRLGMIQSIGRLIQQVITAGSLSVSILLFSPWLLLLLIAGIIPAFLVERFTKLSNQIYLENVALARRRLVAGAFLSLVGTAGYYSAYVYVIWRTVAGFLSIGTLTFLTGAIVQASSNIQQIFSTLSSIADQALFLTDLLAFFEMRPTIRSKPNALPTPSPILHGFEFRNVSFRYPGTSRLVLRDLNFRLGAGERVALIGENGEGKTTLVKLMTRLYDPEKGQVLLDGVDLREYNLEDLYRKIGVIFQDFVRYEMTARENIAIGQIEDLGNLERLQLAAKKSMADTVIGRLPCGYEQMLGRRFEEGVDLSGGEWQKVALARAYLRDAQVLILDEPTAALDPRSEYAVFQRFADLTAGKTALFISHRFSTVRMADRIVVLENGRIAEDGNHEELANLGGRYAEMFEMQAA